MKRPWKKKPHYQRASQSQERWQLVGVSVAALAAVASAVAAWASVQQVTVARRAARDAAVAARQIEACVAISTAASKAESRAHRIFETAGPLGPAFALGPADYADAAESFVEAIDVYHRHSLFLDEDQDQAGQDVKNAAVAVAALFLAMRENPEGFVTDEAKEDLIQSLEASEHKFRLACRTALK